MSDEKDMVQLEVRYEAGHSYDEAWEKTKWFCLSCGKQTVWMRLGGGDYEAGDYFLCPSCDAFFMISREPDTDHRRDWQNRQRLAVLKEASRE